MEIKRPRVPVGGGGGGGGCDIAKKINILINKQTFVYAQQDFF